MSSNGTPQSYLYQNRPQNDTRDRSMEQQYTNSGNPYGYMPYYSQQQSNLGRYTPPMQTTGPWAASSFGVGPYQGGAYNYNLPSSYGMGTLPSGNSFMPQYQTPPGMEQNWMQNPGMQGGMIFPPYGGAGPGGYGSSGGGNQQQLAQQMQAGGPKPYMPSFNYSPPNGGLQTGPAPSQAQPVANQQMPNNGVPSNGTLPTPVGANSGLPAGPAPQPQFTPNLKALLGSKFQQPQPSLSFMPKFGAYGTLSPV